MCGVEEGVWGGGVCGVKGGVWGEGRCVGWKEGVCGVE